MDGILTRLAVRLEGQLLAAFCLRKRGSNMPGLRWSTSS